MFEDPSVPRRHPLLHENIDHLLPQLRWIPDGAPSSVCECLIANAEDAPAKTLGPRLKLMGADLSKVHFLDLVQVDGAESCLTLNRHVEALREWLVAHPMVRAVFVDPLAAFLGKVDSHKNAEVRAVLQPLARLAIQLKVAFVFIDHLNKGDGKAIHRGVGSIAFTAGPRAVWQVVKDPADEGRSLFLQVKVNNQSTRVKGLAYRPDAAQGIVWDADPVTISADEVAAISADGGGAAGEEARDWIMEQLAAGPVASKELEERARAKKDEFSWRTVKTQKGLLGIVSRKKPDGSWWWYPKGQSLEGGQPKGPT